MYDFENSEIPITGIVLSGENAMKIDNGLLHFVP